MMVNGSQGIGTLLMASVFLVSCGDGVSNLLGTETTEPSKFEGVDDGVKAKFTKIESIKPNETLTLKVELFSFLSNDALSLTNLSPLSFVPSEVGVVDAPEGGLRYSNGFVSRIKLLDPLSCGKFIITDLKIILCPGSVNVAFTSSQNPSVSIGTSLDNMFEVGAGAKGSEEFTNIEKDISVALSENQEQATQPSVDKKTETSAPATTTTNTHFLGKKPLSHATTEVSIVGLSSNVTARAVFAKDYLVLTYIDDEKGYRKIRVYDKNFSQGFTLLKETSFSKTFDRVNAIAVSPDGGRILISGFDRITNNPVAPDDVVLIEIPYNKATNTFGTEKSEVISNNRLGQYASSVGGNGVIHVYDSAGTGVVRYVGFTSGSSQGVSQAKLFFIEGVVGSNAMSVTADVSISTFPASYVSGVLYKDGIATSYVGEIAEANKASETVSYKVSSNLGAITIENNYGPNLLQDVFAGNRGAFRRDAFYVDGSDVLISFSAGNPSEVGLARLDSAGKTTWTYVFPNVVEQALQNLDYDSAGSGHALAVFFRSAYDGQPAFLKIQGFTLSY